MRQRSSPTSAKRASETGHIVVIDDQQCFLTKQIPANALDSSKSRKRQSSSAVARVTRKLVPLVVLGLCLQGAYLLRNSPLRSKLTAAVSARILGESSPKEEKSTPEKVAPDVSQEVKLEPPEPQQEQEGGEQSAAVPKIEGTAENAKSSVKIPNVLVVGAQFSGTAAVASWLFHHDSVCKPKSIQGGKPIKEARFFDAPDFESTNSPEKYAKHFDHCEKSKTHLVDATSDYFQYADRVRQVYNKVGEEASNNLKVVMVLREPVDREFSWYQNVLAQAKKPNPPKYTNSVKNKKGQFINFERYLDNTVLPKLESSHAGYAKFFNEWTIKFDRKQLLVMSYDELATDTASARARLEKFLNLEPDDKIPISTLEVKSVNKNIPSCAAQNKLAEVFEDSTNELYKLLDTHKGPEAEQSPFPHFQLSACKPATDKKESAQKKASASKPATKKEDAGKENVVKKKSKANRAPPTTVFFATHHKTGTDISRSVAGLLKHKELVKYSADEMDERDLLKTVDGKDVECKGSKDMPEIRSYNQWSKWIIDNMWGKCVGKWWDKWPLDSTTDDLLEKCLTGEMDSLKEQLEAAACGKDYLVVHFVRNPIDVMLSSYRYTKLGKEEWMHENIVGHPRFLGEYCGDSECFDMTIQEAIRDLPTEVGLQLDMHLVSMEVVKQMMVGSVLAKADPEHHITVSLTDIMESSKSFNKTWYTILSGIFPERKPDFIQKIVKSLSKFDMNADPENFVGNGHSTAGKTSQKETDMHTKSLQSDEGVKHMMKDPIVKTLM